MVADTTKEREGLAVEIVFLRFGIGYWNNVWSGRGLHMEKCKFYKESAWSKCWHITFLV